MRTAAILVIGAVCASCRGDRAPPIIVDLGGGRAPPVVVAVAPGGSSTASSGGTIAWRSDGDEARMRAARSHRPLLVFVSAAWDTASKLLEEHELADPRVVNAARGAVALRIDVTDVDGPHDVLLDQLAVKSVPVVVVLAANGREIYRADASRIDVAALLDALAAP